MGPRQAGPHWYVRCAKGVGRPIGPVTYCVGLLPRDQKGATVYGLNRLAAHSVGGLNYDEIGVQFWTSIGQSDSLAINPESQTISNFTPPSRSPVFSVRKKKCRLVVAHTTHALLNAPGCSRGSRRKFHIIFTCFRMLSTPSVSNYKSF